MGDKWEQNPVWFIVNGFCWNRYMFDYFKHNSAKSLGRYSKMQPAQKKKKVPARWTKVGRHCWSTLRYMPFVTAVVH